MGTISIADDPGSIQRYRLRVLRQALLLEIRGMRRSRPPSVYALIKKEFGLKGSRMRLYESFCDVVAKKEVEVYPYLKGET